MQEWKFVINNVHVKLDVYTLHRYVAAIIIC